MKYIIIGLGNFGSSLAEKLTQTGNEVIGVDIDMEKVESLKEKVTHTMRLDCTDPNAVSHLPLKDSDAVIVCIGENEGANIMATALMKLSKPKKLISRSVSQLHESVLEAMLVDEIIRPEEETASRFSKKLNMKGVIDSFELSVDYGIVEAKIPERFVGSNLVELKLREKHNILVLTIIKTKKNKTPLGTSKEEQEVQGVVSPTEELVEDDIWVLYGKLKDIDKLLNE